MANRPGALGTSGPGIHGTTHERPCDRFERDERAALKPLPANPLAVRRRRVSRRVAADCFVDVDTIRYSVPYALVRRTVEVLVGDSEVTIFDGTKEVARHRRSSEPHARIVDAAHFNGLWRRQEDVVASTWEEATREHLSQAAVRVAA